MAQLVIIMGDCSVDPINEPNFEWNFYFKIIFTSVLDCQRLNIFHLDWYFRL